LTPKKRADLNVWEVEGEGIVYDPNSGMGHVLNPTALRIWSLCDGRHTPKAIEKALVHEFPDKGDIIPGDVGMALAQFGDLGLLETAH